MAARLSLHSVIRFLLKPRSIIFARTCQATATLHKYDEKEKEKSFDELLKSSRFFRSNFNEGSPVGQKVVAKIIAEREDDLYVDFGGKFHAVVPRPVKNGHLYVKGKWVDVIVEDLEVTEHFLGSSKDTSLLEAQVKLTGLSTHVRSKPTSSTVPIPNKQSN